MHQLDFSRMKIVEDEIVIPYLNNECARIRIRTAVVAEYEDVEFYWNDHTNEEEEHWYWRKAYNQPDKEEIRMILEELDRYVADKDKVS